MRSRVPSPRQVAGTPFHILQMGRSRHHQYGREPQNRLLALILAEPQKRLWGLILPPHQQCHCPFPSPLHLLNVHLQQTYNWSPASGFSLSNPAFILSTRDVPLKQRTDFTTFPANVSSVSPCNV